MQTLINLGGFKNMMDIPTPSPLDAIEDLIEVHDLFGIINYYCELHNEEYVEPVKRVRSALRAIISIWIEDIENTIANRERKFVERISIVPSVRESGTTSCKTASVVFDEVIKECLILRALKEPVPHVEVAYNKLISLKERYNYYYTNKMKEVDCLLLNKDEAHKRLFVLSEFMDV